MPELPEVAASAKYFKRLALGQKIASARVKDARIVRGLTPFELEEQLSGQTFYFHQAARKISFCENRRRQVADRALRDERLSSVLRTTR
ncbi:MAG: DNA-formamidopyrimidine glycosylase family protein [Syntrophobacteraceae bacterium]|nr:DNA-formamidopyrimidine glycosylase family protein [Syntrophobacteraceae bacterium]